MQARGVVMCLVLALGGCAIGGEDDPQLDGEVPGVWEDLGPARLADDQVAVEGPIDQEEAAPGPITIRPVGDPIVLHAVNLLEGRAYRVTVDPAELEQLVDYVDGPGADIGLVLVDPI